MSKINLTPNASGTGTLTVTSPNTNTDYTLTLPAVTGTFNTSGAVNEVPAGTVSAPSIYFTGDTNTGIYSPGADTIAFTEGGVEAMRIDTSGNVGIGVSPSQRLDVSNVSRYTFNVGNSYTLQTSVNAANSAFADDYKNALSHIWQTSGTERMRITSGGDLQFNSGYGSVATAYGCRAWVNFNGTGTVAIRASGNVSSITDNGTGDYTVNFTNAMTDANYSVVALGEWTSGVTNVTFATTSTLNSTSGARIRYMNTSSAVNDTPVATVAVFR